MADRIRSGKITISNHELNVILQRFGTETLTFALSKLQPVSQPMKRDVSVKDAVKDDRFEDFGDSIHFSEPEDDTSQNSRDAKRQKTASPARNTASQQKPSSTGNTAPTDKNAKDDAPAKIVRDAVVSGKKQPTQKELEEGIVEEVLGIVVDGETIKFRVKWLSFDESHNSDLVIESMEHYHFGNHVIGKLTVFVHISFFVQL